MSDEVSNTSHGWSGSVGPPQVAPNLQFVAGDFTADDPMPMRSRRESSMLLKPSIWSWLGVVHYLNVRTIRSTLTEVAGLSAWSRRHAKLRI
jgi:O-methyltransferase involved in polyketide biosynthesis